jgi:hypothetical protein
LSATTSDDFAMDDQTRWHGSCLFLLNFIKKKNCEFYRWNKSNINSIKYVRPFFYLKILEFSENTCFAYKNDNFNLLIN